MPWLHLLFDAYEDYKRLREHETAEREAVERAVLEAGEHGEGSGDDDEDDERRKEKKKKRHKDKKK
jgi:hypothetical protein